VVIRDVDYEVCPGVSDYFSFEITGDGERSKHAKEN
jgi:hypothetical protein